MFPPCVLACAVLFLSGVTALFAADPAGATAGALPVHARLGAGPARENSGIVRSRTRPDLFWMQNDSGDQPRVYPVHADGSVYTSVREPEAPGVLIAGAINVDWEDIAVDSDNHLIVGDFGNNRNDRRDLVLYYIDEPSPTAERTTVKKKLFFRYPEQTAFPAHAEQFNFDAEALFTVGTTVYILSKNRSDTRTTLYRLDDPQPHVTNVLTPVTSFDIGGKVTAADASADGRRLVVTTYERIWLFETDGDHDRWFEGRVSSLGYVVRGVEAVCFEDDAHLLLASERLASLYRVSLADLQAHRPVR